MVLLRIEVYPAAEGAPPLTPQTRPAVTHYASLASSSSSSSSAQEDGENGGGRRLWSMGRKQGDCLVTTDKSVSREHVVLSVTTVKQTLLPTAARATTPAQVQACQAASDQLGVVLRNIGKLGSYLVIEETPAAKDGAAHDSKTKAADDDDDSDTADDEEVAKSQRHPQSKALAAAPAVTDVALSEITQRLTFPATARLRLIAADETIVLESLSSSNADTITATSRTPPQRVILQCGKLGTTLVVTRFRIRLVASSDAKGPLAALAHSLYSIGCTLHDALLTDDDDDGDEEMTTSTTNSTAPGPAPTYLVAEAYVPKPKHLAAWSRGIPIVRLSFVHALLTGRRSPADPFPDARRHAPPVADTGGNDFWSRTPNPNLWSPCTLLSVHPQGDELEAVVRSAGAKIVPLYDAHGTLLSDEEAVRAIVQGTAGGGCFALDSRIKLTRLLKKLGVPLLSGKQLALCITKQKPLADALGKLVGHFRPPEPAVTAEIVQPTGHGSGAAARGDDDAQHPVAVAPGLLSSRQPPPDATLAPAAVDHRRRAMDEPAATTTPSVGSRARTVPPGAATPPTPAAQRRTTRHTPRRAATAAKDAAVAAATEHSQEEDDMSGDEGETAAASTIGTNTKARCKAKAESRGKAKAGAVASNDDQESSSAIPADAARERAPPKQNGSESEIPARPNATAVNETDGNSDDQPSRNSRDHNNNNNNNKRKEMAAASSEGGWMTALPQGKQRLEYRRTQDELRLATGLDVLHESVTERVKVRYHQTTASAFSPAAAAAEGASTTTTTTTTGGQPPKNFKAFRKNSVPPPVGAAVRLRPAVSKDTAHRFGDTERQRDEIEAQQRRADALFGDGLVPAAAGGAARTRRRR